MFTYIFPIAKIFKLLYANANSSCCHFSCASAIFSSASCQTVKMCCSQSTQACKSLSHAFRPFSVFRAALLVDTMKLVIAGTFPT